MANYASERDEEFFAAIGRLTISWAQIELGLDSAIDIVNRYLGGNKIAPKAPRLSLSRKTEYLRKWAKSAPEPTFRESMQKLLGQIDSASVIRNDIIHGVIVKHEEGSGEAEIVRLVHSANSTNKKYLTISTVQILQAAVDAGKLGRKSLMLGEELQKNLSAGERS